MVMPMICHNCQGPADVLYRANPIGEMGIWWCYGCMANAGKEVDSEIEELAAIILHPLPKNRAARRSDKALSKGAVDPAGQVHTVAGAKTHLPSGLPLSGL